jgi:hypothetical protein
VSEIEALRITVPIVLILIPLVLLIHSCFKKDE